MPFARWAGVVGLLAGVVLFAAAPAPEQGPDLQLLQQHKIPTDGVGLLQYLRKQFTVPVTEEQMQALIAELGSDSFEKREAASLALVQIGPRAKKLLQEALRNDDLEIKLRAGGCLREIEQAGLNNPVTQAAIRVLAMRKPPGAAKLLLDQLPILEDDPLAREIRAALPPLAVRDGKSDPDLVAALKDRLAIKREAAGVALARGGASDQLPALRKLLDDSDRSTRLSLALALVQLKQKEAVPILISEMDQPLTARFGETEDILFQLARDKSPQLEDSAEAARTRYRQAWQAWWKENAATTDLAVLNEAARPVGNTVVVLLDDNQVVDLDPLKKVRWKIDNVQMPLDLQPLSPDRVLLAEYKANRVSERNSKGEIVWEYKIDEPLVAQRLITGNTFIANRREIVEVDRKGKQVFSFSPPDGSYIMRARKMPGGDILLISQLTVTFCVRLNRFGEKVSQFGVQVGTSGGRVELLPNGNLLIPEMANDRVCEFDPSGKLIRAITVQQPIAAIPLPNGNVLATSMSEKRAVELDRSGKEVWEYRRDSRVTRAVRY